jgi:hypothetical protein
MNNKKFDAVEMMRKIRDELSTQFKHMTFEEQKDFMKRRLEQAV